MNQTPSSSRSELCEFLWRTQLLRRRRIRKILERYSSLQELRQADAQSLQAFIEIPFDGVSKLLAEAGSTCALKSEYAFFTIEDENYPASLRNLSDPPCTLYYRGDFASLSHPRPWIGIVGTREASRYALQACRQIVEEVKPFNPLIVSGMALGVDGSAHRNALELGLPTLGVLGTPIDSDYPLEHVELFREMEARGLLFSELPPGAAMAPWRFLERNRLIAALADVLIVVEAPERSGALATAREALELGKEIYVVPGRFDTPANRGGHRLIQEGAHLLVEVQEIFHAQTLPPTTATMTAPALPEEMARLSAVFAGDPLHIDKIAELSDLPSSQVSGILTNLVLTGFLRELPGHYFELISR